MERNDKVYYGLCAWAAIPMAFVVVAFVDEVPPLWMLAIISFLTQEYIRKVTIPFLGEHDVDLPLLGYKRVCDQEGD